MFDSQTSQFVGFLHSDQLRGGGSCPWIGHLRQGRTPVGETCDDSGNPARVDRPQSGVDGGQRLPALCGQSGVLQVPLGGVDRAHCVPGRTDGIAHGLAGFLDYIAGLAVFEGSLARPVQGTRYRSLSKSLPLSRSSQ